MVGVGFTIIGKTSVLAQAAVGPGEQMVYIIDIEGLRTGLGELILPGRVTKEGPPDKESVVELPIQTCVFPATEMV